MKVAIILSAIAGLSSTVSASDYFGLIAVYSASPIHLRPIVANSLGLYIGKKTESYCPAEVKAMHACPPGKNTNYAGGKGSLFMGAEVPGGQEVYIDRKTGAIHYTIAHSANTYGGITTGWSIKPQEGEDYSILSYKRGLVACPVGSDDYQIFANLKGIDFSPACIGPFSAIAEPESKPDAWQYT